MKVGWYRKTKRTSGHVDQKEIQSHRQRKIIQTTPLVVEPRLIASRPRGNRSYCHPTRVVPQPQKAQRRVRVWAAPCSLAFWLATTRSRTLADRALGPLLSIPSPAIKHPTAVAFVHSGEGDVHACLLGDYRRGVAYSVVQTDEALMLFAYAPPPYSHQRPLGSCGSRARQPSDLSIFTLSTRLHILFVCAFPSGDTFFYFFACSSYLGIWGGRQGSVNCRLGDGIPERVAIDQSSLSHPPARTLFFLYDSPEFILFLPLFRVLCQELRITDTHHGY
jgi:hypothetical protein